MPVSALGQTHRTHTGNARSFDIDELRALIARHLNVEIGRVTDEAHLSTDLGADWLDRLELVILVEEITGAEITDSEADRIDIVGDLISFIDER